MPSEILGVAPWVIIAAAVSWFSSMYANRDKKRDDATDHSTKLVVHRDELTLQIIRTGREEISAARLEVDDLRDEVRKLRAMETHFYHFQQSLDHLEALLTANTPAEHADAERNARAFVNRMRRLQSAKGTVANEVQRAQSETSVSDQETKNG